MKNTIDGYASFGIIRKVSSIARAPCCRKTIFVDGVEVSSLDERPRVTESVSEVESG